MAVRSSSEVYLGQAQALRGNLNVHRLSGKPASGQMSAYQEQYATLQLLVGELGENTFSRQAREVLRECGEMIAGFQRTGAPSSGRRELPSTGPKTMTGTKTQFSIKARGSTEPIGRAICTAATAAALETVLSSDDPDQLGASDLDATLDRGLDIYMRSIHETDHEVGHNLMADEIREAGASRLRFGTTGYGVLGCSLANPSTRCTSEVTYGEMIGQLIQDRGEEERIGAIITKGPESIMIVIKKTPEGNAFYFYDSHGQMPGGKQGPVYLHRETSLAGAVRFLSARMPRTVLPDVANFQADMFNSIDFTPVTMPQRRASAVLERKERKDWEPRRRTRETEVVRETGSVATTVLQPARQTALSGVGGVLRNPKFLIPVVAALFIFVLGAINARMSS